MASTVDAVEDEEIVNDDLVNKCSVMHCGRLNKNIDYKFYEQKLCYIVWKRLRSDNK